MSKIIKRLKIFNLTTATPIFLSTCLEINTNPPNFDTATQPNRKPPNIWSSFNHIRIQYLTSQPSPNHSILFHRNFPAKVRVLCFPVKYCPDTANLDLKHSLPPNSSWANSDRREEHAADLRLWSLQRFPAPREIPKSTCLGRNRKEVDGCR